MLVPDPLLYGSCEEPRSSAPDALRASVYALLARLLVRSPDAGVLALLRAPPVDAGVDDTGMASAWQALHQAAEQADEQAAQEEYFNLFIGVGRGELVPYGAWYLSGLLMGRSLAVLRAELAQLGFARREGVQEPEDHAGALCETMSMIIANEAEIPFERQRQFFNKHLDPWLERFFLDLQGAPSARFYRAVGRLGEQVIQVERRYFSMWC